MCEILLGVEFLHKSGIIHRDLKPSNILIFKNINGYRAKISDFGMAIPWSKQSRGCYGVVTLWYRAPELINHQDYGFPIDIWSVGCIFYEMASKRALLEGVSDKNVKKTIEKIFSKSPPTYFSYLKSQPDTFRDLLTHLLDVNPLTRYTATQALAHDFFKDEQNFISKIRSENEISIPSIPSLTYSNIQYRQRLYPIIQCLFQNRRNLSWYSNRIFLHSLDILDRVVYSYTEFDQLSDDLINLLLLISLYISIKYFTVMSIPISFSQLATDEFLTAEYLLLAENLEVKILRDILHFQVYYETFFETADRLNFKLTDTHIESLLKCIYTDASYFNLSYSDILCKLFNLTL